MLITLLPIRHAHASADAADECRSHCLIFSAASAFAIFRHAIIFRFRIISSPPLLFFSSFAADMRVCCR